MSDEIQFGPKMQDYTPELIKSHIGEFSRIFSNGNTVYGRIASSTVEVTKLDLYLVDYSTAKKRSIVLQGGIPLSLRTASINIIIPVTRQHLEDLCVNEEIKKDEQPK